MLIAGVAGAILGATLGYWAAWNHFKKANEADAVLYFASGIARDLPMLKCMAEGNTKHAERMIRSHLLTQIMVLERVLAAQPQSQRDTKLVTILDNANAFFRTNRFIEPPPPQTP
jgi:hypothetical protein